MKPLPYQLMTALTQVGDGVPLAVQAALEKALELSLAKVPVLEGNVVVCPDVSGSMSSPATGYRKGATSVVRCIDIAALVSATMLRSNSQTRVLPFEVDVVKLKLDPKARVAVNAAKLAGVGGGGTNVSAPLALLNREKAMEQLKIRLYEKERSERDAERAEARASQIGTGDRSQKVRTYNYPENRVTDHRIGLTLYSLDKIITGDKLNDVVEALITEDRARKLAAMEAN